MREMGDRQERVPARNTEMLGARGAGLGAEKGRDIGYCVCDCFLKQDCEGATRS